MSKLTRGIISISDPQKLTIELEITGDSRIFGGEDLQIEAIIGLIEMMDFKCLLQRHPDVVHRTEQRIMTAMETSWSEPGVTQSNPGNARLTGVNW